MRITGIHRSTDLTPVCSIAGSLEAKLGGDKREAILRGQRQCQRVVSTSRRRERSTRVVDDGRLGDVALTRRTLIVLRSADGQGLTSLPRLGGKACRQLIRIHHDIVALLQSALVQLIGNGPGNVHTGGVLRLAAHLDIRDAQPLACSIASVPRIDANLQLVALLKFDDGGSVHFVHHTAGH